MIKFNPMKGEWDKTGGGSGASAASQAQILNSIVTHQLENNVVIDGSLEMDFAAVVIDESGNVVYSEVN